MPQNTIVEQLNLNIESLKTSLSIERLEKYINRTSSIEEAFDEYIRNIILSEALYPSLQNCEIGLRNSIHREASKVFKNELWFYDENNLLQQGKNNAHNLFKTKEAIEKAKERLIKKNKSVNQAGRIVAELNFGFWVGFFNRSYDSTFWRKIKLKKVFPNCPYLKGVRGEVAERLNLIIVLRNRVFHHEPIIDLDLEKIHKYTLEVLSWINLDLTKITQSTDKFSQINYRKSINAN